MFHKNLVLIVPVLGGGISVTGGALTLIQTGLSQLAFTNAAGTPITPDTVVSSDPAKAQVTNGGLLTGVGTSGSCTITASKIGYADGTVTVTCSGGLIQNMVVGVGGNTTTDGVSLTSWTDQGTAAQTWAEAVVPPTYKTGGVNGQPYILFDGTTQFISSPSTTAYNVAGDDSFQLICVKTIADSPASNRNLRTSYDGTPTFRGMQFVATTNNTARIQYGTGAAQATIDANAGANTILAANSYYLSSLLRNNGALGQTFYINGVAQTTITNTYRDNGAAVIHRIGVTLAGGLNFAGEQVYNIKKVNRAPTTTEIAQLHLAAKTLMGL